LTCDRHSPNPVIISSNVDASAGGHFHLGAFALLAHQDQENPAMFEVEAGLIALQD
jgi:hypothetical protein